MLFKFVLYLSAVAAALATVGVDVSQPTSLSSWQCAKKDGFNFAVVRVYCSSGHTDSAGPQNIQNAWNAGIAHVDGYIFPCFSCGNPAGQMDATINYLSSHVSIDGLDGVQGNSTVGVKVGMLWLDIEGTQYWGSSASANTNFIVAMANQGKARGVSIGVYTSKSQWTPITGSSTAMKSYPLWYAHYDNNPSFSDFSAFGGWTKPAIKQYAGDVSFCSAGWDKSYY
jgi:GH25 family lysozyme M1 (1,4-beta-N-acetylmuramidase)